MTHRYMTYLFGGMICVGLGFALLAAVLITLEFDEAWIIASNLGVFQPDALPEVRRVLTTGGLHLLVMGALAAPGAEAVVVARGLSLVCLLLLLILIERTTRTWFPDLTARMIVLLMVLATPGTLFLGGMGYGVMAAMFLILSGAAFWIYWDRSNWVRICVAGGLLGVAFATRWTLLPLLPLLVLSGVLLPPQTHRRWIMGFVMAIWALIVFAVFVIWQSDAFGVSQNTQTQSILQANAAAAGLYPTFPTPARITGFASRLFTLTSAPVILGAFGVAYTLRDQLPDTLRRVLLGLAAAFVIVILAWVLRSPFLHTRYIWPAVLMGNIASGLILAHLFMLVREAQETIAKVLRAFCLLVPLGLAVETYMLGARLIAMGANHETNNAGYSGQEHHFDAFRLIKEQKAIMAFLTETTAAEDRIMTLGVPAQWSGMQMSLLAQRKIESFPEAGSDQPVPVPDWLITHEFAQVTAAGQGWLQQVAEAPEVIFGYRVYKIRPEGFSVPDGTLLSNPAIYRFSLSRELSLSGY